MYKRIVIIQMISHFKPGCNYHAFASETLSDTLIKKF